MRAHQALVVEGGQVVVGAAAAGDDEHVDAGAVALPATEAADRLGHRRGRAGALHWRGHEDDLGQRKAPLEHAQQIVDDRAALGRDDADASRQPRASGACGWC